MYKVHISTMHRYRAALLMYQEAVNEIS